MRLPSGPTSAISDRAHVAAPCSPAASRRDASTSHGERKLIAAQSPRAMRSVSIHWTVPSASSRSRRRASSPASYAVAGFRARFTTRVGGLGASAPKRRQTSRISPIFVFSEKKMRRGSCELTMVSMCRPSARNWRSARLPGAVGTTDGSTMASVPPSSAIILVPSTVNIPPEEWRRAAAWWGCPESISFSRSLIARSSSTVN